MSEIRFTPNREELEIIHLVGEKLEIKKTNQALRTLIKLFRNNLDKIDLSLNGDSLAKGTPKPKKVKRGK